MARRSKVNMDLGLIYMVSGTRDNPPPSYPGRANFSPVSLASSTNRSHEDHQLVKRRRDNSAGGGGARCLTLAVRVTLACGTTFSHMNTLARLPGTIFSCRVSRNVWCWFKWDWFSKMYFEEIIFKQTEATVITSTNKF